MKPIVRNIAAIPVGWFLGALVNIALVNAGPHVIPPPPGGDITSLEGLKATIHLFQPQHFLFPFLGHALGTLVGAFIAAKLAATYGVRFALGVGTLFLVGGIANIFMIGGPVWFTVIDLAAYLPMGWLGGRLAVTSATPRQDGERR